MSRSEWEVYWRGGYQVQGAESVSSAPCTAAATSCSPSSRRSTTPRRTGPGWGSPTVRSRSRKARAHDVCARCHHRPGGRGRARVRGGGCVVTDLREQLKQATDDLERERMLRQLAEKERAEALAPVHELAQAMEAKWQRQRVGSYDYREALNRLLEVLADADDHEKGQPA